ncbi:MAG: type II secretion system F family protein [Candidatus Diapherotrites archaeon]
MALRLMERIPVLNSIGFLKYYSKMLAWSGFRFDPFLWILFSIFLSIFLVVGSWAGSDALINYLEMDSLTSVLAGLPLVVFIVAIDLTIGFPLLNALKRIDEIEETLPDALRQMADTLRAGGTYEYALREVAASEYGALKMEMGYVLRKLEEGENFENSLKVLSKIDSRLIQRTVTIIVDSVKAGAGLADILEQIAEDVRSTHRINKERRSKTGLQVIFLVTAGSLVAPAIFGFISTVVSFLILAAQGVADDAAIKAADKAREDITLLIQIYVLIETLAASIMISLMRDGKMSKSIIYFPLLLLVAYICFTVVLFGSRSIMGGIS